VSDNTQGYFYTDWSAMTSQDWAGMIITVVIFALMVIAYYLVFRPKNKDKFESHKNIPLDDEFTEHGEK
jgi:cytochrome c oxidase cbb3-type subunit 4